MFLHNLALFLKIVELGGMAAAGREFGLSPATVSERLAALEAYYGARLLTRTTRSISLTDEGRDLVDGARRILAEAEETEARIKLGVTKVAGTIHLSAPNDLGRNRIAPLLDQFMALHPDVSINLTLSDGYLDLAGRGIDLALRFGRLADSSLKQKIIGPSQRIVCASPAYLARHGTPHHPDALSDHNCLLMRFETKLDNDWMFSIDGRDAIRHVRGNRMTNDSELVKRWACCGHGIALKSTWDVAAELTSGALVQVLQDYASPQNQLQIVYPSGATHPRRVRLLITYLEKTLTG